MKPIVKTCIRSAGVANELYRPHSTICAGIADTTRVGKKDQNQKPNPKSPMVLGPYICAERLVVF